MCQRKFRPIKCTCHYSYKLWDVYFGSPSIYRKCNMVKNKPHSS